MCACLTTLRAMLSRLFPDFFAHTPQAEASSSSAAVDPEMARIGELENSRKSSKKTDSESLDRVDSGSGGTGNERPPRWGVR
jgi:hypothetical protein